MIDKLLEDLLWSQPKIVETKNGLMTVQNADMPDNFWEVWKLYKDEIKKLGISPNKYQGQWNIAKWKKYIPIEDRKAEKRKHIKLKESLPILYDYQQKHAEKLINSLLSYNAAVDASDTGTGKTFVALAVAKHLNLFPVVITPKSVIPSWIKVAKIVDIECYVNNYEQYKIDNTPYLEKMKWNVPENSLLIWDECHKAKSYKTQNAKMLIKAKKQGLKILGLSATVGDNPLHLYAIGYALGLFENNNEFWVWAFRRGVKKGYFGFEFKNTIDNLKKIHDDIFPHRGNRIRIKELGNEFPDNLIIADSYNMDNAEKIQEIYKIMRRELYKLRKTKEKDKASVLTEILRMRQEVELLKVPTFVELAENAVEEGNSVVIFVNFEETVQTLSAKLKTDCIITGKISGEQRQKNIDMFQNGTNRIIICNIAAGGVGISLNDVSGNYPRVSLISPSYSAQDLLQALGRIHRAGSKSPAIQKIVFCDGTIEDEICEKVSMKIDQISLINNGDLKC